MRTSDFDYELPPGLIAQQPVARGKSRLMVVDRATGRVEHDRFASLPDRLDAGDLLLLNDTRVIPARLFATRSTGRRFELLLLRAVEDDRWEALLRPSARARQGERLSLSDGGVVVPEKRRTEGRWLLRFEPSLDLDRLDGLGEAPLPPYIERPTGATDDDRTSYQTVYAAAPGAVAAPTAGLHFTAEMLAALGERGVELASLTLHVGLGTFRPLSVEVVEEHEMHEEWYRIPPATAAAVNAALADDRCIVCVGTTTVRALEAALATTGGTLAPGDGWTDLFLTPGCEFKGTAALLTNFHLPRSTLLMLVSAFAGRELILEAYAEAIRSRYRFYSYGDAMLIV